MNIIKYIDINEKFIWVESNSTIAHLWNFESTQNHSMMFILFAVNIDM